MQVNFDSQVKGTSGHAPSCVDARDFDDEHPMVAARRATITPGAHADLRRWFNRVWDQEDLNACPAFAATALLEYFNRRFVGFAPVCSVEFVYRMTLQFARKGGNVPTDCRTTMKTLALLGAPPNTHFPTRTDLDDLPELLDLPTQGVAPFVYALAANYKADRYFRLDGYAMHEAQPKRKARGATILDKAKLHLACDVPVIFSMYLYAPNGLPEMAQATMEDGVLPAPPEQIVRATRGAIAMRASMAAVFGQSKEESVSPKASAAELPDVVGHTLTVCGYDNARVCPRSGGGETVGALLVRNSWSAAWGENGYGWVPYLYVTEGLTEDWWTLDKRQWRDDRAFDSLPGDNI